jgi:hypothetical protein
MGPCVRRDDVRPARTQTINVIASEAKQSTLQQSRKLDCFVATLLAMTML